MINTLAELHRQPSFKHRNEIIYVVFGRYQPGGLAVELICEDGETYTTLSTNIGHSECLGTRGRFFAKTYSENEAIAASALKSGLFADMGLKIQSGFVEIPLWEFIGDINLLPEWNRNI